MPYAIDGCSGEAVSRFTDKQWILSKHGQPLAILLGENADTSGFWDTLFSEKTMCQSQSQNLGKSPILGLGINPSIGICILIISIHLQCQGLILHPLHGNRSFNIWLRNHAQPIILVVLLGSWSGPKSKPVSVLGPIDPTWVCLTSVQVLCFDRIQRNCRKTQSHEETASWQSGRETLDGGWTPFYIFARYRKRCEQADMHFSSTSDRPWSHWTHGPTSLVIW